MSPSKRRPVRKSSSARKFRSNVSRMKAANLGGLARGGWRL